MTESLMQTFLKSIYAKLKFVKYDNEPWKTGMILKMKNGKTLLVGDVDSAGIFPDGTGIYPHEIVEFSHVGQIGATNEAAAAKDAAEGIIDASYTKDDRKSITVTTTKPLFNKCIPITLDIDAGPYQKY